MRWSRGMAMCVLTGRVLIVSGNNNVRVCPKPLSSASEPATSESRGTRQITNVQTAAYSITQC